MPPGRAGFPGPRGNGAPFATRAGTLVDGLRAALGTIGLSLRTARPAFRTEARTAACAPSRSRFGCEPARGAGTAPRRGRPLLEVDEGVPLAASCIGTDGHRDLLPETAGPACFHTGMDSAGRTARLRQGRNGSSRARARNGPSRCRRGPGSDRRATSEAAPAAPPRPRASRSGRVASTREFRRWTRATPAGSKPAAVTVRRRVPAGASLLRLPRPAAGAAQERAGSAASRGRRPDGAALGLRARALPSAAAVLPRVSADGSPPPSDRGKNSGRPAFVSDSPGRAPRDRAPPSGRPCRSATVDFPRSIGGVANHCAEAETRNPPRLFLARRSGTRVIASWHSVRRREPGRSERGFDRPIGPSPPGPDRRRALRPVRRRRCTVPALERCACGTPP
jgi:hypothetical protein